MELEEILMDTMKNKIDIPKDDIQEPASDSGWDSTPVADLSKLFSDSLHSCLQTAINDICEKGYNKDLAKDTVLRCGPFYCIKDMVSSIVDRALECLQNENFNGWYTFNDLDSLVEYMMFEMVTMLREVKPCLSVHEAMWALLICDLNVQNASEAELDPQKFSIGGRKSVQEVGKCLKTEPETVGVPTSVTVTITEAEIVSTNKKSNEEKCTCFKNRCSVHKKDTIRQKSYRFENPYKGRMSRRAIKEELASWKKLYLCKTPPISDSSSVKMKIPTFPLKESEEKEKVTTQKAETVQLEPSQPTKTADYYLAGIPYDETKDAHMPQDEKDEILLAAVGQLKSLQKEVKSWENWAIVKVMQVSKRLGYDRSELNKLKADKAEVEKLKKDKQLLDESMANKLTEITVEVNTLNNEIDMADSAILRLESENSAVKQEREIAESQSVFEGKRLEEALCKEQEALKKSESLVSEKILLEEELKSLKQEVGSKLRDLEKAKSLLKETETRLANDKKETAIILKQAEVIRNERKRFESLAKSEDETTIKNGKKRLKQFEDKIKRIQYEIAAINLNTETKRIAAMRTGSESEVSRKDFAYRECVMCLSEEMVVVFVPCGHQVVCGECNVIHEKNGMKDCPSCRTPIQQRITARFAKR